MYAVVTVEATAAELITTLLGTAVLARVLARVLVTAESHKVTTATKVMAAAAAIEESNSSRIPPPLPQLQQLTASRK